MGFIKRRSKNDPIVTEEYIMDNSAYYEIDIAGYRFPIIPQIHPPFFPAENTDRISFKQIGAIKNFANFKGDI